MRPTIHIIGIICLSLVIYWAIAKRKEDMAICPYEGAECPNAQQYLRDYQISLHMDTVWIYDKDRLVGRFTNTTWNSQYDSIFLKDND